MVTQTITVQIKNVYGRETIYPQCTKAQIFARLLGQKTLSAANLAHIQELGYVVTVEPVRHAYAVVPSGSDAVQSC